MQQSDAPDQLAVQYWFYWYFNDWNNTHESDWKFIQVLFDASTVADALTGKVEDQIVEGRLMKSATAKWSTRRSRGLHVRGRPVRRGSAQPSTLR